MKLFKLTALLTALIMSQYVFAFGKSSEINLSSVKEKNPYDPTKIVSELNLGYSNDFHVSGSYAVTDDTMVTLGMSDNLNEWVLGSSLTVGGAIYSLNYYYEEFEDYKDSNMHSISLETYYALTDQRIKPFGIELFPYLGTYYTSGDDYQNKQDLTPEFNNYVPMRSDDIGAYLGLYGLKEITNRFTVFAFGSYSSDFSDYDGYYYGGGLGYEFSDHHIIKGYAIVEDDSYASGDNFGFTYTYEFD